MGIRLSSLPADLQRRILQQAGLPRAPRAPRRPKAPPALRPLSRACACGFEMFRPDGDYPDLCDGCGAPWPGRS